MSHCLLSRVTGRSHWLLLPPLHRTRHISSSVEVQRRFNFSPLGPKMHRSFEQKRTYFSIFFQSGGIKIFHNGNWSLLQPSRGAEARSETKRRHSSPAAAAAAVFVDVHLNQPHCISQLLVVVVVVVVKHPSVLFILFTIITNELSLKFLLFSTSNHQNKNNFVSIYLGHVSTNRHENTWSQAMINDNVALCCTVLFALDSVQALSIWQRQRRHMWGQLELHTATRRHRHWSGRRRNSNED